MVRLSGVQAGEPGMQGEGVQAGGPTGEVQGRSVLAGQGLERALIVCMRM